MSEWLEALKIHRYFKSLPLFFKDITGKTPSNRQRELLELASNPEVERIIVSSCTGGGKTLCLSVIAIWFCTILARVLKYPFKILILSGSWEQSRILYNYCREIFDNNKWITEYFRDEPTRSETLFKNGSVIRAIAKSEKQVFGPHPNVFLIDEAGLIEDELLKKAIPRVETEVYRKLILASIPYIYLTLFVEIYEKYKEWGFVRLPYWSAFDCPWIDESSIERARKTLDQTTFRIHYLGEPVPLVGKIFNEEDLKECRILNRLTPLKDINTTLGIDWGYEHPTVIVILQKMGEKIGVIHTEEHSGERFDDLLKKIRSLCIKFKVQNIVADRSHIDTNQRLTSQCYDLGIQVREVAFKTEKDTMIGKLRSLIEKHKLLIPAEEWTLIDQLRHYTWETKRNDDYVDALMLACRDLYEADKDLSIKKLSYYSVDRGEL